MGPRVRPSIRMLSSDEMKFQVGTEISKEYLTTVLDNSGLKAIGMLA
jgi:hypothetical protein